MQAHFNEKYLESDKYPRASFKGKFKENINLEKEGTYPIQIEGKFSIHGVERFKKIVCNINVKDQNITFDSNFEILSANYKIKAPDLLYRKVGEEVRVDIKGILILDKEK
jgi:polyisoprenoid-binding protein YceI